MGMGHRPRIGGKKRSPTEEKNILRIGKKIMEALASGKRPGSKVKPFGHFYDKVKKAHPQLPEKKIREEADRQWSAQFPWVKK